MTNDTKRKPSYIYIAKYQKLALQWYSIRHPLGTDSLHPKKTFLMGKRKWRKPSGEQQRRILLPGLMDME